MSSMNETETTVAAVRRSLAAASTAVFDFDGTLVDSNRIKRRGFDHVFSGYPDKMPAIREYCYGFNHTVRGEKFRYVTENILGLTYTPELDTLFHQRYADFTTGAVAAAPEIPGAQAFVRSLLPLQPKLLSSTLHSALLEILERRGWLSMFAEIQGAPVDKHAWLVLMQRRLGYEPRTVVFFGDTDEDSDSARRSGCTFVRIGRGPQFPGELAVGDFSPFV